MCPCLSTNVKCLALTLCRSAYTGAQDKHHIFELDRTRRDRLSEKYFQQLYTKSSTKNVFGICLKRTLIYAKDVAMERMSEENISTYVRARLSYSYRRFYDLRAESTILLCLRNSID